MLEVDRVKVLPVLVKASCCDGTKRKLDEEGEVL
jgi:hypothetical protein